MIFHPGQRKRRHEVTGINREAETRPFTVSLQAWNGTEQTEGLESLNILQSVIKISRRSLSFSGQGSHSVHFLNLHQTCYNCEVRASRSVSVTLS